jgi:hypothetical protein
MSGQEPCQAVLTSEWLVNYIREHGGVMTVVRDLVVD